jgi:hypothetical protein
MGRKKNIKFRLNPEWMFKEPVDFEYNKYTLLDYLQKCEKNFDSLKIYPDFVELSLHLANSQSITKENIILSTNKKFESCDDEILLKEIVSRKPPKLSKEEKVELEKTLNFSNVKLIDAFNIAKSIWNIAFDNVHISVKKNKEFLNVGQGFLIFYQKEKNNMMVWEYEVKRSNNELYNTKVIVKKIYDSVLEEETLISIIEKNSTWKDNDFLKHLPVFEVKSNQDFPIEETLVPIMKRKLMAYLLQLINLQNFDNKI